MVYLVDISSYDDELCFDAVGVTELSSSILYFEAFGCSKFLKPAKVILLFHGGDEFEQKLRIHPVKHYFLDYQGKNEVREATDYFIDQFRKVNRKGIDLYPFLVGKLDGRDSGDIWKAIGDVLVDK